MLSTHLLIINKIHVIIIIIKILTTTATTTIIIIVTTNSTILIIIVTIWRQAYYVRAEATAANCCKSCSTSASFVFLLCLYFYICVEVKV